MKEETMVSVISLSIAAVLLTLILTIFASCDRSDIRAKKLIETCASYGGSWGPIPTPNGKDRTDFVMGCIKNGQ